MCIGFSPHEQSLSLYIMPGFNDYASLLLKALRSSSSVSRALYIKRLADTGLLPTKNSSGISSCETQSRRDNADGVLLHPGN